MNVFILDKDLATSVEYHCDKHVIKMILEAAQIASTVHWETGGEGPYKSTHVNHPLVRWACSSLAAYRYVVKYGLQLCKEYTYRYGKIHKTQEKLEWLKTNEPDVPKVGTKFQIIVADDCKVKGDEVTSYRKYYIKYKFHILSWKKRPEPPWLRDHSYLLP
jgi:hypothetical protein